MTTLRDVLDEPGGDLMPPTLRDRTEAWAYGTERECPECEGLAVLEGRVANPCPTCHGTGKVREAGLVERVQAAALSEHGLDIIAALRAELGDPDDR